MAEPPCGEIIWINDPNINEGVPVTCTRQRGHVTPHGANIDGPAVLGVIEWRSPRF